jgi:hypothetical protein
LNAIDVLIFAWTFFSQKEQEFDPLAAMLRTSKGKAVPLQA